MSKTLLNLLIDRMDAKSNPCAKHLKQAANDLTSDELSDLEKLIDIFQKQGFSLDFQCSAYQQVLDMTELYPLCWTPEMNGIIHS